MEQGMKAIICGGRDFTDREYLWLVMNWAKNWWNLTIIIHGGAKGADTLEGDWAKYRGLTVIKVPALWDLHGKSASIIRNKEMLGLQPNVMIAFEGGAGTENMITISRKAGVPVFIA